uniref:Uncharacterized protein n=1 Tax=Panstrongylus lignarius TaxID=156445 RepID=A0A224XU57_9HEMI
MYFWTALPPQPQRRWQSSGLVGVVAVLALVAAVLAVVDAVVGIVADLGSLLLTSWEACLHLVRILDHCALAHWLCVISVVLYVQCNLYNLQSVLQSIRYMLEEYLLV